MSNNIVEVKTVQCAAMKTLFETLKEILTDVNLIFDREGMKIIAMEGSHVAVVYMRLKKEGFDYYYCGTDKFIAGINTSAFFIMLKSMGAQDILTLAIDRDNESELFIKIENGVKNKIDRSWYRLLDIDQAEFQIPPKEFDFVIKMPSNEFQSMCKIMKDIGSDITICSHARQLKVVCEGDFGKKEITLMESKTPQTGISTIDATNENPNHMVMAKFSLKFLLMFTKATSLCNMVELYLANDFPLIIRYMVAALGELKFALSPKLVE